MLLVISRKFLEFEAKIVAKSDFVFPTRSRGNSPSERGESGKTGFKRVGMAADLESVVKKLVIGPT